jgi:hypothetical protein
MYVHMLPISLRRTLQVFAAQLQLVRAQISRAKMRAETMARRAPIGSELGAGKGQRDGYDYVPGIRETLAELKLSSARPRVSAA